MAAAFTVTGGPASAQAPSLEQLWEIVQRQQAEIDGLRQELAVATQTIHHGGGRATRIELPCVPNEQ